MLINYSEGMRLMAFVVACAALGCQNDVCDDLQDRAFASDELLPCGMQDCAWTLEFRSGRYLWRHDEVADSGSYSCGNDDISATSDTGATFAGRYDTDAEVLSWDGRTYHLTTP